MLLRGNYAVPMFTVKRSARDENANFLDAEPQLKKVYLVLRGSVWK
jgi:hypothetical protein